MTYHKIQRIIILIFCSCIFTFFKVYAQADKILNTPTSGTITASRSIKLEPGFSTASFHAYIVPGGDPIIQAPTTTKNYVITNTIRIPGIQVAAQISGLKAEQLQQTVSYYDGLGRPVQTVVTQGSPSYRDIVQPNVYDATGKETRKYLPFVPAANGDGSYKDVDINQSVINYYNDPSTGKAKDTGIETITAPYADKRVEASALNRILEQGFPGTDWQLGNKTIRTAYSANGDNEVRLWTVNSNGADGSTFYAANTLRKTIITDENGNNKITFTDVQDRTVFAELQSNSGYLATYFVYDDLGKLRYVIPPIPNGQPSAFTINDQVFKNYLYAYNYDNYGRVTEKKVAGKDWEYVVFNSKNQLILSQDGRQRTNGIWIFAKYDNQGRIVYTGEMSSNSSRLDLQATVDGTAGNWIETFTNSTTNNGYTNSSYPTTFNKILSVNYYDQYDYLANTTINPNGLVFTAPSASIDTLLQRPNGMLTGTKTNILGTTDYLFGINHYDTYGRIAKTVIQNYKGGSISSGQYDVQEMIYDFTGNPLTVTHTQYISGSEPLTVQNSYTYDQAGRKRLIKESYNGAQPVILARYDYNELGQLITKHQHSSSTSTLPDVSTFFQHFTYKYNSRGWLYQINDPDNLNDPSYGNHPDAFALRLHYNDTYSGTKARWTGDITAMEWQTKLPQLATLTQEKKAFTYAYDATSRLTNASYFNNANTENGRYNEDISYDIIGNITSLKRNNTAAGQSLNNLTYNYGTGSNMSNQLLSIADAGTESYNSNYTYDVNGSVKTDTEKGLTGSGNEITYNNFNLPAHIQFNSGKTIDYLYNAAGATLRRVIKLNGSVQEARDYTAGMEYTNTNGLEYIHNAEGRALPTSAGAGTFVNEYTATDHLGNIRSLYGDKNNNGLLDAGDILQVSDYYAFGREINYGAAMPTYPSNQYKFNGKELQTDLTQYNYGARFYDPIIARWHVIDPHSDSYINSSPYNYAYNNPVKFTDPNGADLDDVPDIWAQTGESIFQPEINIEGGFGISGLEGANEGEKGKVIDEKTGEVIDHNGDGTITSHAQTLNEVVIHAQRTGTSQDGGFWSGFLDNKPSSNFKATSTFLGETGLLEGTTENLLRTTLRGASTLGDKAYVLRTIKGAARTGAAITALSVGATLVEDYNRDRGISWGTGAKSVILGAGIAFPAFGFAYGIVDLSTGIVTGKTLTDRIGDGLDSAIDH